MIIFNLFLLILSFINYRCQPTPTNIQEQKSDSEELTEDEKTTTKTNRSEDKVSNYEASGENLIIIDDSDIECDTTNTRVKKSACKNRKVAQGKKLKSEVNHLLIKAMPLSLLIRF